MVIVFVLGGLLAAFVVAVLMFRSAGVPLAVAYARIAWLPVAALIVEALIWKPVLTRLSYFAVVPLLLTCIVSLFFAVIGATLVAQARERGEGRTHLVRATMVAAIPGAL